MVNKAGNRLTKISGLATYVPPRLLTNKDLEKMVATSDEWILQRTGIRQRHIVDPGVATSDLAKEAALKAIAQAGLTPDDIDFIVVGTTTPDMMFPSTACLVQEKIGAGNGLGVRSRRGVLWIRLRPDDGCSYGVRRARTNMRWPSALTSCRASSTTPIDPRACYLATVQGRLS